MSDVIIPDEWLVHDLRGDNGEKAQRESMSLLGSVTRKCDKIAILAGGPFADKIYTLLMKDNNVEIRRISRYFRLQFIMNSVKCVMLPYAKEIDEQLSSKIPPSDRHLFEIREALGEGLIVTTDSDLSELQGVKMRSEFLREYG